MLDDASPSAPPVEEGHVAVVGPQFTAASQVDLIATMKPGSFVVTDVNGNVVFKVNGSIFSHRRLIVDNADRPVISIRQKTISPHSRCQIFRGDSSDMADLLCHVKLLSLFKTGLGVFLASNTKEEVPDFKIKRSWLDRTCTIYLGNSNNIIAHMRKKQNALSLSLNDTFAVTVYPNVDYAFIVGLVVVMSLVKSSGGVSSAS